MKIINVTQIFIILTAVAAIAYYLIQIYKEKRNPRMVSRKKLLCLSMLFWGLLFISGLGRWSIFFSWY